MKQSLKILSKMLPIPSSLDPCVGTSILLTGPAGSCKSCLAFQACISMLDDPDATVLVLAPEAMPKLPLAVHHMPRVKRSHGDRLLIQYFKQSGDLIIFLSQLHTKGNKLPTVIFIEDLHIFVADRRTVGDKDCDAISITSNIIPLAVDLIGHCMKELGKPCLLMMTTRDEDDKRCESDIPVIGRLFMQHVVHLEKQEHLDTSDRTHFVLSVNNGIKIRYYIDKKVIFLDDFRRDVPPLDQLPQIKGEDQEESGDKVKQNFPIRVKSED